MNQFSIFSFTLRLTLVNLINNLFISSIVISHPIYSLHHPRITFHYTTFPHICSHNTYLTPTRTSLARSASTSKGGTHITKKIVVQSSPSLQIRTNHTNFIPIHINLYQIISITIYSSLTLRHIYTNYYKLGSYNL